MNTKPSIGLSTYKNSIVTTIMVVFSAMVLVVSCPLNKMLKSKHASHTSTPSKINQTNNIQHSGIQNRTATNCNFAIKNADIVKPPLPWQQTITGPLNLLDILNQPGFEKNIFPGCKNYNKNDLVTNYSKLPLFLQHHSFLI